MEPWAASQQRSPLSSFPTPGAEREEPVHEWPLLTPWYSAWEDTKTAGSEVSSLCHKTQPGRHKGCKVTCLNPSLLYWSTRQELFIYVLIHQNTLGHPAAFPHTASSAWGLGEKLYTPLHPSQQGLEWLVSDSNAIVKYYWVARKKYHQTCLYLTVFPSHSNGIMLHTISSLHNATNYLLMQNKAFQCKAPYRNPEEHFLSILTANL